jgi:hypothetical protein
MYKRWGMGGSEVDRSSWGIVGDNVRNRGKLLSCRLIGIIPPARPHLSETSTPCHARTSHAGTGLLPSVGCTAFFIEFVFEKMDLPTATPWWTHIYI